tara:strand:- start:678 stop:1070 length:393 start_codon:yes stop_codon:yes gene_type:complete
MKVIFIDTPTPMFTSFTMFANFPIDLLKEKKTLTITARHETKTRVCTTVSIGQHSSTINWSADGIKTFEKSEHNYFSGRSDNKNYFVLSKAQGKEKYKEYVATILQTLCTNYKIDGIEELTVNLITDKVF